MRNLILRIFWPKFYFEDSYKKGYEAARNKFLKEIASDRIYLKGYRDCESDLSENYDKALDRVQNELVKVYGADIKVVSERESGQDLVTGIPTHTLITKAYPTKEFQVRSKLNKLDVHRLPLGGLK